MKMKNIIIAAVLVSASPLLAQDVHFSHITEAPLLLNPSQAGLGHDIRASVNYKDQWRSVISAPYKTISAQADMALMKKDNGTHLGVGLSVFNDKAGDANMVSTGVNLHVAGIIGLNSSNLLSVGLSGGYGMAGMNYDALTWGNQYDGQQYDGSIASGEPQSYSAFNYFDISAGASWYFATGNSTLSSKDARIYNIGFAVQHINQPVFSFYSDNSAKLPMKIVAHGNAVIGMKNTNLILEPSYYFAMQAGHMEVTPGILCKYVFGQTSMYTDRKKSSAISFGGYFRVKDAIVPMIRYEFSNWAVTTSYDINVSGLSAATRARGGFEVSIRFLTPNPFGGRSGGKSLI